MPRQQSADLTAPLPKGWPRRVRSAVVHSVSMAQASLTIARGWTANSANARIRLKTENDQLRQEIGLLLTGTLRLRPRIHRPRKLDLARAGPRFKPPRGLSPALIS